jgi:hypothetical protein
MIWAGYVQSIGRMKNAYKVLVAEPEGKDHSEDQGVDGRILEWV